MKSKVFKNFGLKILSIILAVLLWLMVMNISDYVVTVELKDIPVEQLNGDVLESLDQVYEVVEGNTVDIIVKGRRSVVDNLIAADFKAVADLSTMSITNSVQIYVTPRSKSLENDISITIVDNTMTLALEEKITKQFGVKVKIVGEPISGYAVGKTYATPNIITVEGPKSTVEKITEAVVLVSVTQKEESFDCTESLILYDAYGDVINSDKVSLSENMIDVKVDIHPVKSVSVVVDVKGTPGDGYAISEINYQPQSIMIAGLPEDLRNITEVKINDIYVSGMTEDVSETIDLSDYLPDDIILAQTETEVVINVVIEKIEDKAIAVSAKDITLEGKNESYTYKVNLGSPFNVTVSGLAKDIEELDVTDIMPIIDCSKLGIGNHQNIELTCKEIDGVTYKVNGTISVTVEE